jgi:hypothetical protein
MDTGFLLHEKLPGVTTHQSATAQEIRPATPKHPYTNAAIQLAPALADTGTKMATTGEIANWSAQKVALK